MELKVFCDCGSKYKFDVDPANGRMPFPVACPVCGADGTEQANMLIKAALTVGLASAGTARPASPPPDSPPLIEPSAPAASASSVSGSPGLRVARAPSDPASAASSVGTSVPAAAGSGFAPGSGNAPVFPLSTESGPVPSGRGAPMRGPVAHGGGDGGGGGRGPLKWVLPLALALGVVGFGIWRFGERWISRLHYALQAGNALQDGAREEETEIPPQNFWFDDCVVLFVRHPSVGEVARACTDYWRATLRRPLTILTNAEAEFGHGQFELWQEQGGYVRLFGGLDWPEAQYEGLARHLSDRFKTQVFEARAVSFSGAYHFGAYDQGTRQFHARMEPEIRNGTVDDKVSTENAPWAVANGYQPGKDGFQSFTLSDADKITQQLGMKTWGGGTNQAAGAVWLRETGRAGN